MKTLCILLLSFIILSCKKDDEYNNIPHKYIPDYKTGDTLVFIDSSFSKLEFICKGSETSYYKHRINDDYETYEQNYRGEFSRLDGSINPLIVGISPGIVSLAISPNWILKISYQKNFGEINESSIFSEEVLGNTYHNLVSMGTYPVSSRHARYDLFKGIVSYQDTLGKEWKLKEIKR